MIKELVTKKKLAAFAAALLLLPCLFAFAEDDDLQSQLSDVQSQMERQQQKREKPKRLSATFLNGCASFSKIWMRP